MKSTLLCLLLALMPSISTPAAEASPREASHGSQPNFLLLLSDDQTHRALGFLKDWPVRTPNLDRLARRGLVFTHCFNQGGYSGAVCIPSRAMLNTGRTVWQCRKDNKGEGLDDRVALWGETLGKAGYDTFIAGKWHLPQFALERSFKTLGPLTGGFLPSTTNRGAAYLRPAPGNPWTPTDPQWKGHWLNVEGKTVHSSVRIADAAIDYLAARRGKASHPFFMYVAFNAPHDPRQAPAEYLALYQPSKLPLPRNFLPRHPFLIDNFQERDEILAPYPRTPEIIRTHMQEYFAIVTHMDAQIGKILDALESSGEAENTLIIFTSDQGLALGQHGLMGKQNLYDPSLRIPFILSGPGVPRGKQNDALIHMQSLFATTCEMAGIQTPETVQFPSLIPLIRGEKKELRSALYGAFLNRQRSVRTQDWKLIRTPGAGEVQLFHVSRDPWETRNLARDPRHASTLAEMDARLRTLMAEMHDPLSEEQVFVTKPRDGAESR